MMKHIGPEERKINFGKLKKQQQNARFLSPYAKIELN